MGATLALAFALAIAAPEPAWADILLRCSTKEVVMTSGPRGQAIERRKVELAFRINDAMKTMALGDARLSVSRFDKGRIIAEHEEVIYDLDRQNRALNYAGSRSSGATVTTIVGAGPCAVEPTKRSSRTKKSPR